MPFLVAIQYHPQIGCANEELARAEAMFELTRDWVRERKAFGRRVADLQTVNLYLHPKTPNNLLFTQVQHKLAELKTSLTVCRAFVDSCLSLHNSSKLDSEMSSMAKYWATDLQNKVAGDCLQLHGGFSELIKPNVSLLHTSFPD